MLTTLALALVLVAATAGAEDAGQESKPVPKDSVEIEARGCLKGRVFTATGMPEEEGARRGVDVTGRNFRVTGPRESMDLVKKYDRQFVEILGVVRKSALSDEGLGMRVGDRARVVIGQPGADPTRMTQRTNTAPGVATMDVIAVRLLSDRCPID